MLQKQGLQSRIQNFRIMGYEQNRSSGNSNGGQNIFVMKFFCVHQGKILKFYIESKNLEFLFPPAWRIFRARNFLKNLEIQYFCSLGVILAVGRQFCCLYNILQRRLGFFFFPSLTVTTTSKLSRAITTSHVRKKKKILYDNGVSLPPVHQESTTFSTHDHAIFFFCRFLFITSLTSKNLSEYAKRKRGVSE